MTLREWLAGLDGVKKSGEGWVSRCPGPQHEHGDRKRSLSNKEKDGKILLHCFVGCTAEEIVKARGHTLADLFLEPRQAKAKGAAARIVAEYDYVDVTGTLLYQNVRYEPKDFRQRRPNPEGGWLWTMGGVQRVVYRLPDLAEQRRVFLVEGEKDVNNLWAVGIPATTSAGGAESWRDEFAAQLQAAGVEEVIILPDNDPPGLKYAAKAAASITAVGLKARTLTLPGLPERGDVSDWLQAGHQADELEQLAVHAPLVRMPQADGVILTNLDHVPPEEVEWLWRGRIARGKLTIAIGQPGAGKTTVMMDVISRVTLGSPWPDGCGAAPDGRALVLTAEDGLADTIRPHIDRQGGDPKRIFAIQGVRIEGADCPFNFERDLPALERALIEHPDIVLLLVDPLSAYLGARDSYKDAEIRGLLSPLTALADKYRVAVVAILHPTKSQQRAMLMRAQGSIAFVAAARTVIVVGEDPETPGRRLLGSLKNNLGEKAKPLAFRIDDAGLSWIGDVEGDVDHLLAGDDQETRSETTERAQAAAFLRDVLSNGAMASKQVQADAKENGISQRTLWRAKRDLKILVEQAKTQTGKRAWYWMLPPAAPA